MSDNLQRMACPQCGQRIKFDAEDAGTEAVCPHCDTPVVLGGEAAPAPSGEVLPVAPPVTSGAAPPPPPPPPPMPEVGVGRLKMIAIPVVVFLVVFGLIIAAAVIVKKKRQKAVKVEIVDGKEVIVEVEDEDAEDDNGLRKASPKVKKLEGYKRPFEQVVKKKIVFDNPTSRKRGDPTQLLGHKVINAELGSMQYVVGIVTNHTKKRYFDVEVFFDLYDEKNKKIGEAKDYLGTLPPNGSWELKATIFERGAKSAKLRKIDKQAE